MTRIIKCRESGIYDHLLRDILSFNYKLLIAFNSKDNTIFDVLESKDLSLEYTFDLFYLLFIGIYLSFLVFMAELWLSQIFLG